MAIGKVNAYATVQAPNVDFGDIALNAQKFQEADIERQKELKAAQLKVEKPKPIEVPETGNFIPGGYSISDATLTQGLESLKKNLYDIGKRAQEAGGINNLSIEEQITFKNGNKAAESFNTIAKQTADNVNEFISNYHKASGVSDELYKVITSTVDSPNDVEHSFENGNWVHRIPIIETDKEGNRKFVLDSNNNKTYKQWYNSDGNLVSSFTQGDLQTKAALRIVPKVDVIKRANEIQGIVKATIGQTDTGTVKVKDLYYANSRVKNAVDASVENAVSDRATRLNLLYDLYSEYKNRKDITPEFKAEIQRYSHPMREDEYNEKDMNNARSKFKNLIEGGFGGEHTVDVTIPSKSGDDDKDKNPYTITRGTSELDKFYNKDLKNRNKNIAVWKKPLIIPDNVGAYGLDGRFVNIPSGSIVTQGTFHTGGGALVKVGNLVSKSTTKKPSEQDISFINTKINQGASEQDLQVAAKTLGFEYNTKWRVIPKATADQIIPGGVDSLKEDLYNQPVPKTKVKANQGNKPLSTEEFNSKWSKLKKGEKLVGPDGKTYTKS